MFYIAIYVSYRLFNCFTGRDKPSPYKFGMDDEHAGRFHVHNGGGFANFVMKSFNQPMGFLTPRIIFQHLSFRMERTVQPPDTS